MKYTPKIPTTAIEMWHDGMNRIVQSRVEAILHAYEEPYENVIVDMLHLAILEGIFLGNSRVADLA